MPKKVGKAVAAWSKKTLIVPPGHPDEGKPLILPSYFVRFFDEVYEDGVIEGGVAISRKNAKTSCCAALILYYLCGPGYREGF